jgi:hypothetical protein
VGFSFQVDKERRLVTVSAWDKIDKETVMRFRNELVAHPDFHPDFNQLCEYQPGTKLAMTSQEVDALKFNDPFSAVSRRAFVTHSDVLFGYARMYAILMESKGYHTIQVFRDMAEATKWIEDGTSS